jgi:hypothetical protein
MVVFEVEDKNGKLIRLTKEQWEHINKEHNELTANPYTFEEALKYPIKITQYKFDKKNKIFL